MLWNDPNLLWLLIGVGAIAGLLAVLLRRRAALMHAFADKALVGRLAPDVDLRRRAWRVGLRVAALVLLVLAVAGPKWGFHWQEVHREGIDLIVAIDTSRSMLAGDVKPNRLERAKLAILDLLPLLEGDRIGLVAFAGTAFLECPLTLDYAAFERSLRAVDVGLIPMGGTALARAIDTSLKAFEARQGKYEALILITDGEDHEGNVTQAAELAAEQGVKIFSIGIGTTGGELVPLGGAERGFVKDQDGQVVKSRLGEGTLQEIALTTGGVYARGLGPTLGLDEVFYDHIAKLERREVASALERRYEQRFQIPLALVVVLLVMETLIGDRKSLAGRRRRWFRRRRGEAGEHTRQEPAGQSRAAFVLVLLMPTLVGWFDPPGDRAAEGNALYAEEKYGEAVDIYSEGLVDAPDSPLLQFNRAAALYKDAKYQQATDPLAKLAVSDQPEWTGDAAYNLGNALYRIGADAESSDPQSAIASYEQALVAYKRSMASDPTDMDAKFNHEFVSRKLQELKERLEEQQQDQQEQEPEEDEQGEEGQQEQQEQQNQQGEQEPQRDQQQDQQEHQRQQAAQEDSPPDEPLPDVDEQAAQAILDAARSEELGPEDLLRDVGVAGLREPTRDW